jgi:hypothetical protein
VGQNASVQRHFSSNPTITGQWRVGLDLTGRALDAFAREVARVAGIRYSFQLRLIQSWCSSCACFWRRPWPTIESRRQIGHWRMIAAGSAAAQSASPLPSAAEGEIKTIVAMGLCSGF